MVPTRERQKVRGDSSDCIIKMTAPEALYDVLLGCAQLHGSIGQCSFLVSHHTRPLHTRTCNEQLLYCQYWSQLCQRLYERRDSTARYTIGIEIWLPWYTSETDSYVMYQLGQLIALERLMISTVFGHLQLTKNGAKEKGYLTRGCTSIDMAMKLVGQIPYVIHQVYQFTKANFIAGFHDALITLQEEDGSRYWTLLIQQYHLLRVLCMWLIAVSALHEISTTRLRVAELRQRALDNMQTLIDVVEQHLKPEECVDQSYNRQIHQLLQGARIETNLCRAEHFRGIGDDLTASSLYAQAEVDLKWIPTSEVRALQEQVFEEYKSETVEDLLQLAMREPVGQSHPEFHLTGCSGPARHTVSKDTPWRLTCSS